MLLNKLAEDTNKNNYPENVYNASLETLTTAASDYFARKRRNMCSSVNDIFRVVYIDIDLNVSIDDNNTDLKSCLESYFQILQTDECQRCGNKNAPALTYLWRLPEVLIIHLGRGKPDGTKNNRFIDFPMQNLDMTTYLHPNSPDLIEKENSMYDLYGIL
uniref:ubiquitinyl hydrolase 1 n=1 Tax=Meloidogyne enterolobii TaxID=390850 RepID=A0A6V7WPC1_MELEN|nr:unnamed protein product [Meloidogyne enterolobii]